MPDNNYDITQGPNTAFEEGRNQIDFPQPVIPQVPDLGNFGNITNSEWSDGTITADRAELALYNAENAIANTSNRLTPGSALSINPQTIDITGRYPFQRVGFDNEELYAQGQSWLSKAGNALGKATGLAATTFLNGTAGLLFGLGAWVNNGKFSSLYDNDFTRSLDQFNQNLENQLPNYYTRQERDAEWYSPNNWFTANFVFDKVIKNLGFAAGAALTGGVYSAAIKGIAGLTAVGRMSTALEATENALAVERGAQLGEMTKTIADASRQYVGAWSTLNKAQRVLVAGLATTGEASMEALQTANEFKKNMVNDFINKQGREPNEEEIKKIEKYADNASAVDFLLNVGILSATNYIQFPKILGSSFKAERNLLTQSADRVILKEGESTLGTLARTAEGQAYSIPTRSRLARAHDFSKYLFNPTEGLEESLQFVAQTGAENYYNKKFNNENATVLDDLFGEGFKQALTTKEGIENFLIGGLSGAIMTARGTYSQDKEDRDFNNSAVSSFNQRYVKSYLKDSIDSANRAATLQQEREQVIRSGDVLESKDLEMDYVFNYLYPRIKHGRLDLVKTDLEHYAQLASTDAGFQELVQDGIINPSETKQSVLTKIAGIKQLADDVNNTYQALTIKYSPLTDKQGNRLYSPEVIEKMAYAAAKVSDYDRRLVQVANDILSKGVTFNEETIKKAQPGEELTQAVADTLKQIDELDIFPEVKDNLKQSVSDYVEIALRRRAQADEYNEIRTNPTNYKVDETPTDIAQPTTVTVTTADGEEDLEVGTEYYLGHVTRYDAKGREIQSFPKLTILGQNEDGTLKIRGSNGEVRDVSAEELAEYKLGKVSDVKNNAKAKFYMENVNTIFEFNFGKGNIEKGRLRYSPKEGVLEFVYKNSKGKIKAVEVTADQFSMQLAKKKGFDQPIIRPVGNLSGAQFDSLEAFKAFKDDERRTAKAAFKVKVLTDLMTEKKSDIDKINNRLQNQEDRLIEARLELEQTRDEISKFTEDTALGTKSRKFRKEFRQLIDLADDLSREINQLEEDINTLKASKVDVERELSDLENVLDESSALDEGEALLEQLLGLRFDAEKLNDTIDDQIKYLSGYVKDAQKLLDDLFDFIFAGKTAAEYGITEDMLRDLKESPSTLEFVRSNPNLFQGLREVINRVDLLGNKLTLAQDNVADIESQLDNLAKQYKRNEELAKLYDDLFETFDKKAKEYAEEQVQIKLLEESEEFKKRIFQQQKGYEDTSGDTYTGDPELDRSKYADEGDRKKPITHFFVSGTEPRYENKGLPDNDFHRRHQRFLDKLTKGEIANSDKIRVVPITINNQADWGLEGWIKPNEKDAIRLVYVGVLDGGSYIFLNENGKAISASEGLSTAELAGDVATDNTNILERIVYTNLPTSDLVDTGNRLRYNNETGLSQAQIKDLQDQWNKSRAKILEVKTAEATPAWSFAVSRGIEQTSNKENTVLETKVIDTADLDSPLISVSTTGFIEVRPAGDVAGVEDAIAIPVGRPMLNINAGLSFLNNHNLVNDQQKDILGLLKILAKNVAERAIKGQKEGLLGPIEVEGESYDIIKYLQNVLHWKVPGEGKKPGRNQIWIQNGQLHLGSNDVKVPFTPRAIERDQAKIIGFLSGTYHNVNNKPLNDIEQGKPSEFVELGVNDKGQPYAKRAWKNYNHYLLNDTNPDGSKRQPVLTTRLIIPQSSDELQFVQRYPIVNMDDLAPKAREIKAAPKAAPKAEAKPASTIKKAPVENEEEEDESGLGLDPEEARIYAKMEKSKVEETLVFTTNKGGKVTYKTSESAFIADKETAFTIESVKDAAGNDITAGILADDQQLKAIITLVGNEYLTIFKKRALEAIRNKAAKIETKEEISKQAKNDLAEADDVIEESSFRQVLPSYKPYTASELAAEEKWFKERFPNVEFKRVTDLIDTIGGTKAWGMFKQAAVYIYEQADIGTTYHEAFEAVWNAFSYPAEKATLLKEFRNREGSFTNFSGKTVKYSEASYNDAKEQMAEEFRDFKLTGKLPQAQPKRISFFRRLLNFIKEFVFGSPTTIADVFNRIERGYYADLVPAVKSSMPSYREVKQAPEVQIQDVLEGMTVEFFSEVFEKDDDIVIAMEENPGEAVNAIYGRLYNRLQNWFEGKAGLAAYYKSLIKDKPQLSSVLERQYQDIRYGDGLNGNPFGWEFVKSNWKTYVAEHTQYLRRYGIEVEANGEFGIEDVFGSEEEDLNRNKVEYERDILRISAKNAASKSIKFMFSTIADSNFADNPQGYIVDRSQSTLKMAKQANYAKLFNYVMHTLAGRNSIYNMNKVLAETSKNTKIKQNANVRRLQARLKWSDFANKSINQMKLLLKFENVFAKFKPTFSAQRVDMSGNNYTINANTNTKVEQIVGSWVNNLKKSSYVTVKAGKYYISNIPGVSSGGLGDRLRFLKAAFGINITPEQVADLPANAKKQFNDAINGAQFAIKSISNKPLGSLSDRALGISRRISNLAEVVISNFTGNDLESQHTNLTGKAITNFVMHNYVSLTISDLNDVKNRDEFLALNPHLKDIYSQQSLLLDKGGIIFDDNGNIKRIPTVNIPEGRLDENTGKRIPVDKLALGERLLYEINENLNGRFYILLPADSKTEWSISTGTYTDSRNFFQNRGPQIQKFNATMRRYLENEIALAQDYSRRKDVTQLSNIDKETNRPIGKNLRFFKNILSAEQVKKIHEQVIDRQKNLYDVVSEDAINAAIANFIDTKVASQRKTLENERIIESNTSGAHEFYGLSKDWLQENLSKTADLSDAQVNNILQYRTMNYIINNIEMHKMFFMDPASYKDATKRIKSFLSGREYSHVDPDGRNFNAWANKILNKVGEITLQPKDRGYHTFSNNMKTYTVRDVQVVARDIEDIKKALGNKSGAYEDITETDAQSLATLPAYREMLIKAGGRWTNGQENQFQYEMAYERNALNKKGLYTYSSTALANADKALLDKGNPNKTGSIVFHTLKPIHSGVQYKDGIAIPSLDKTSMMPMFYRLIEGRQMENLYNQMIGNGVHYVRYETAHKVGIQSSSTVDLYNEDGTVADHKPGSYEYIPYKYYGIQVETAGVKDEQTRGTQLTKLATSNLFNDGVPIDFEGTKEQWDRLPEAEKLESPAYKLASEHTEILNELARRGYKKILSKLGVTENEDGTFTYVDKQKVADFVLNEVTSRELAQNISDGIKIDPDTGDFVIPLEALSNYRGVRNIIYSVVEKNLIRPKMSGSPHVQVSSALFEKNPRLVAHKDKNGKTYFTSNELAFYKTGEDGKTLACEIMLPHWFGAKLRDSNSNKTDAELIDYLNNSPEGKELLRGVGFRIPTDELHAAEFFTIKEFLPQEFGDTVVVPSEITAKAGSDFDIDKLNLYLKNFYINAKGFPQVIKFTTIDTNDEEQLKDLYEKKYSRYIGKMKMIQDELQAQESAGKLTAAILEQMKERELSKAGTDAEKATIEEEYDDLIAEAISNKESKIPTLEEYIKENKGKSVYELNSREAVENKYYETIESLLALPQNFAQLISPTSADNIKDAAEFIKDVKGIKDTTKGLDYTRLLDPDWMSRERHKFIIGKGGVGIAAVSQTNIAINQLTGISVDLVPRFPHNSNPDGSVSVSRRLDKGGVPIAAKNSGYVNGFVDVAKGADIIDAGADLNVASTMMLLEKMGVPNDKKNGFWVSLFIAQPAVQEYLKQDNLVRSTSAMNPNIMIEFTQAGFGRYSDRISKIVANKFPHNPIKVTGAQFDYKQMESVARKYYKGEKLTDAENQLQMELLSHFIELNSGAWDFFRFIQGYNWDTSRFKDPNAVYRKQLQYDNAKAVPINSVDRVLNTTFEGATKEAIEKADDALNQIFKLHSGRAKLSVNQLVKEVNNLKGLSRDDKDKLANQGEMSLLNYIVQTRSKLGGRSVNEFIDPLMLNTKSAAVQLENLKEQKDKTNSSDNRILDNLQSNIDPDPQRPSIIRLIEKDTDTYMSNMYTASFRELREDSATVRVGNTNKTVADIYRNIIVSQILQNGNVSTSASFIHLIPVEDYSDIVKTAINNINSVDYNFFDDEKVFYRNSWNNPQIVPEAKKTTESEFFAEDPENLRKYLPTYSNDALTQLKQEAGIKNPNNYRILRLSAWAAGNSPVVKETIDRVNPATGKLFSPQEKAEMRKKGDYSYRQVNLFKRVEVNGEPIYIERNIRGNTYKSFVYKPINAWGDGQNLQEYYDYPRASVVATNSPIQELGDSQIIDILERAGFRIESEQAQYSTDQNESISETTPVEESTKPQDEVSKVIEQKEKQSKDCNGKKK
jgi:hypothetical protein